MYMRGDNKTLDTIKVALMDEMEIDVSRSTLRRKLLQNGFKFRKIDSRKVLTEKPEIVAARCRFLRAIKKIRAEVPDRAII